MRPSYLFFTFLFLILMADALFFSLAKKRAVVEQKDDFVMRVLVGNFGLTDLAVASEARYTRHPAVSDKLVPFMDHPGAIEHFPTGSFWLPVQ